MDLKEEIIKIVQLQEIDSRIYSLRQEKDIKKPAQLEALKADFEQKKQTISAFEEKIKATQLKKKDKECQEEKAIDKSLHYNVFHWPDLRGRSQKYDEKNNEGLRVSNQDSKD